MCNEDWFRIRVLRIMRDESKGRSMIFHRVTTKAGQDLNLPVIKRKELLKGMRDRGWILMTRGDVWRIHLTMEGRKALKGLIRLYGEE